MYMALFSLAPICTIIVTKTRTEITAKAISCLLCSLLLHSATYPHTSCSLSLSQKKKKKKKKTPSRTFFLACLSSTSFPFSPLGSKVEICRREPHLSTIYLSVFLCIFTHTYIYISTFKLMRIFVPTGPRFLEQLFCLSPLLIFSFFFLFPPAPLFRCFPFTFLFFFGSYYLLDSFRHFRQAP